MVVIVFRTRLRSDIDPQELAGLGARMYEIASAMPGFVSYKDFTAEDGENVSIVEFESLETLAAWRNNPEHRSAQELGRKRFFLQYRVQVCSPVRDYAYPAG
jgi:heme-degrading monooxygenase HmoA